MTAIRAAGRLLTASLTDRILTYLLLPFEEVGQTSLGQVTASAGTVTWPSDVSSVHLNIEHDGIRPVGKAVAIEETDDGIVASFRIAATSVGDDLLVEADEGLRPGASVELDNPVIRAGRLIKAFLTGAGAVTEPAFPSAQLIAADAGEDTIMEPEAQAEVEEVVTDLEEAVEVLEEAGTEPEVAEAIELVEDALEVVEELPAELPPAEARRVRAAKRKATKAITAAKAKPAPTARKVKAARPATVQPGSLAARRTLNGTGKVTKGDLFKMLATAHRRGGAAALTAALSDVVPGDILGIEQPQFVGELWSGKRYERKIVPLFAHADLTSFEVKGWRWVTKPTVAAYSGGKTAVPSAAIETEPVTISAERLAGAHDIDRKFRDFNDVAFFEAYFAAMTESYARVSDTAVLADVITAAGAPITVGDVPTGVSLAMTMIVDGALAVLNATDTMASFAIVASGLWRDLVLTREEDKLAFLNAALGLEDGTLTSFRVEPSAALTAGQVLVGARDSATVHELPGSPIRVEALDVTNAGVDEGLFGYYAVNVHDADGLALVDDDVA